MSFPEIREATASDWEQIWPFFRQIVNAAETYAYDPEMAEKTARAMWMSGLRASRSSRSPTESSSGPPTPTQTAPGPARTSPGELHGRPGSTGRGIGRAFGEAVSTGRRPGLRGDPVQRRRRDEQRAVGLWHSLGFETIGTVPDAFRLPDGRSPGCTSCIGGSEPRRCRTGTGY